MTNNRLVKIKYLDPGRLFRLKPGGMLFTRIKRPHWYKAEGKILATIRGDKTILKFDPDYPVISIKLGGRPPVKKETIQATLF